MFKNDTPSTWRIKVEGDKYTTETIGSNPEEAYRNINWANNRPAIMTRHYNHRTRELWRYDGERFIELNFYTHTPKEA